jgi:hypothetical protein
MLIQVARCVRLVLLVGFALVIGQSESQAQCRQGQKSPAQFQRGLQQQNLVLQQQLQQLQQQTLLQTALQRQVQQNNLLIGFLARSQTSALSSPLQAAVQTALLQSELLLTALAQQNAGGNQTPLQSSLQQQVSLLSGISQ